MKLLSVLGTFAIQTKPAKTVALAAPVLEVTATIEELTQQATKPKPEMKPVVTAIEELETIAESNIDDSIMSKPLQPDTEPAPAPDLSAGAKPFTNNIGGNAAFDWSQLIEHTRSNYVALFSVLSKCSPELNGDELTLYTGNAFYKKKLDDPKYSAHLYESLKVIGNFQLTIHTIPTPAPLKNSQAASIADIMGGGIEVSPELA